MKQYLKAQTMIPAILFVFIVLYALFLLTGGETQIRQRRGSLNHGENGYSLFHTLYKKLGYKFRNWYEAEPPKEGGCLFYFDYHPEEVKPETMSAIISWVKRGNWLFLVGVHGETDPVLNRRVKTGPALDIKVSNKVSEEPLQISFPASKFLEKRMEDDVLAFGESGPLVIASPLGKGKVYLFADNNLLINRYFFNPDHAVFLNGILKGFYYETFYIYEYGTRTGGYKVQNPVMILFKGDFLYVTLHLFLLGLLFATWKGRRFGAPLPVEPFKRRSISVHLAAVGGFYQKTKAHKIVDALTGKYLVHRARQILNIKKNLSPQELAELLAKHSGNSPEKIKVLLEEPGGGSERMLFMKRQDIHRLIMELREARKR